MDELSFLERAVLEKLLAGTHPLLVPLRAQLQRAGVARRELSGVGFFTVLAVPDDVPRPPHSHDFHLGDVIANIEGLEHGAGFVLFVNNGQISMLEGYSFEGPWPDGIAAFTLAYTVEPRDLSGLG